MAVRTYHPIPPSAQGVPTRARPFSFHLQRIAREAARRVPRSHALISGNYTDHTPNTPQSRPQTLRTGLMPAGANAKQQNGDSMRYFTSDLHLSHPFVAATRGFWNRRMKPEETADINALRAKLGKEAFERLVDTELHDMAIIRYLNSYIGKQDELFILGDISVGSGRGLTNALNALNELNVPPSRIHLILGNHDGFRIRPATGISFALFGFGSISDNYYVELEGPHGIMPTLLTHLPPKKYFCLPPAARREGEGTSGNAFDKSLLKYAPYVPPNTYHLYGHTHGSDPFELRNPMEMNVGIDAWRDGWKLRPVSEEMIVEAFTAIDERYRPGNCLR